MRLAVLLALTSVAHAEPPKGSWTFDGAIGGGVRTLDAGGLRQTSPALAIRLGTGHVFTDHIGFELQFDDAVIRENNVVTGALTMTIGCQFWLAPRWVVALGGGLGGTQSAGVLSGVGESGYALLASGGYAVPIGTGSMLTFVVQASHTAASAAPSIVTATIGFLSL
jgi:hypothetical protein